MAGLTVLSALLGFVVLFRPLGGRVFLGNQSVPPHVTVRPLDGEAGNSLLRDQATFFDPTPLFLPTRENTDQEPLPEPVQRQPGQVFPDFDAKLTYSRPELLLPIETGESTPQRPVDLLQAPSHDPFLGFGRVDTPLSPLDVRTAVVEVREVGTGNLVLKRVLGGEVEIPAGEPGWQPAEFMISVTAEGLLGKPMEVASSNVEDVDLFFRDYLVGSLRLGERLAPGMYRVVVGP